MSLQRLSDLYFLMCVCVQVQKSKFKPLDLCTVDARAQVVVATGFIAKNQAGQVTTLRRNGSDYSATIVGALLRSAGIVIWTDVDGVFSADPRKARAQLPLHLCLIKVWACCVCVHSAWDPPQA